MRISDWSSDVCSSDLVPGYVSYVAGGTVSAGGGAAAVRLPAIGLGLGLCFVLGFATVFVVLGASATALGQLLLAYRYELNIAGGAIVILFGLFLIGAVRPTWLMRDMRFHTAIDRKSVVEGTRVLVRVSLGGRRT